ncbi:MAG: DUF4870 domain-containing protein [Anaerolineales bacterium]
MNDSNAPFPRTAEERFLAALAHLSALTLGVGLALPMVLWSEYRRKSRYLAFQSLQALGYQTLGYTLWFLVYLLAFVVLFVGIIALAALFPAVDEDTLGLGIALFLLAAVFIPLGGYLFVPVVAAIACALGRDFRYPFMGRLEAYLNGEAGDGWFDAEREDRWVAAMGHFSVIIALWGLVVPVLAFFTQRKRSAFLRFQSLQTLIYQAIGTVGVLGGAIVLSVGGFVFGLLAAVNPFLDSVIVIIAALLFLIVLMLFLLLVPFYHILGQWAGLRTLQGRNYRYPLVGRLAARWANPKED